MTGRSLSVAQGVASRGVRGVLKDPPFLLLPLVIPLFFFAAFKGPLSGIGDAPSFGYYDFTAFVFVFTLFTAAMFAGVFTAFGIAEDYEVGMGRRLMLSAPRRMAIVAGYLVVSVGRGIFAVAVVWGVALATGMPVRGDAPEIAAIVVLALLLNLATILYGAGVALRLQSRTSGTLILLPVYVVLFLTPVFVERDQLSDWLQAIAGVNPLTAPIEAGRGLLADDPVSVALAFAASGALLVALTGWAVLGMRKAGQKG